MNCRTLLEHLSDYLEEEAAASVRADLEAHLHECRSCTVIVETSRRTLRIVTDLGSFEIPQDLSERLLKKTMSAFNSCRQQEAGESSSGTGGTGPSRDSGKGPDEPEGGPAA